MPTEFNFEGRNIRLPGVYSTIRSGITNPPLTLSYGNVLIIDTGSGAGFGGGAGISGTLASGIDTVYPVSDIDSFRLLTKGGRWYSLAEPLFTPRFGTNGVSTVYYVRAATTVPAEMTFNPTGGGPNGGAFVVQCRDEGIVGNGVLDSGSELRRGYAFRLRAGVIDSSKFIIDFYRGTYTGTAADGFPYGLSLESASNPLIVVTSVEFADFNELVTWANNDPIFAEFFAIKTQTVAGDGSIDSADLTTFSSYQLAISGTETFDTDGINSVLTAIPTLRYNFLLSDKFGDNAQDAANDLYLSHITSSDTSFSKRLYVGGGRDNTKFTQANGSIPTAQHFDTDKVIVVHGGSIVDSIFSPTRLREQDSLYTTAQVVGRLAGLEPQVPGSFKPLDIAGVIHELTTQEKLQALDAGVLVVHLDTQLPTPSYTILQAVNTLQNNSNIINPDGTSPEISIVRIADQLNLELTVNARLDLFGQEEGPNLNTLSDAIITDWVAGQLQSRTATTTDDNLILSFRNIQVTTQQDAKFVTYEFRPNGPVNKFFLTGFMIN